MRKKLTARVADVVQPYLRSTETVELVTLATVGGDPTRRMVGSAARSGGLSMAVPLRHFIVLTSERMLFVLQNEIGRPKKELAAELPRGELSVGDHGSSSLYRWMELTLRDDPGSTLRLNFPVTTRSDQTTLAAALVADESSIVTGGSSPVI